MTKRGDFPFQSSTHGTACELDLDSSSLLRFRKLAQVDDTAERERTRTKYRVRRKDTRVLGVPSNGRRGKCHVGVVVPAAVIIDCDFDETADAGASSTFITNEEWGVPPTAAE